MVGQPSSASAKAFGRRRVKLRSSPCPSEDGPKRRIVFKLNDEVLAGRKGTVVVIKVIILSRGALQVGAIYFAWRVVASARRPPGRSRQGLFCSGHRISVCFFNWLSGVIATGATPCCARGASGSSTVCAILRPNISMLLSCRLIRSPFEVIANLLAVRGNSLIP